MNYLVLAVALKVFAHGYSLLNEEVKVFGKFGGKTYNNGNHQSRLAVKG